MELLRESFNVPKENDIAAQTDQQHCNIYTNANNKGGKRNERSTVIELISM
jgi:hypothetical protein